MVHGHGGYKRGCHCAVCTQANADYVRMRRVENEAAGLDRIQACADAFAVFDVIDDDLAALGLIRSWEKPRLRAALLVLAAAVNPEWPASRIGAVA